MNQIDDTQFNGSQRRAYNVITSTIGTRSICDKKCFFLNGAAGTGKTYLLNAIAEYCENNNLNFISVAYTGIAACTLIGGSTIHSRFHLSWNEYPAVICNMSNATKNELKQCDVILWDQAAACGKQNFEKIDGFLRALTNNKLPFGGKVVVIAGDFNECLPILQGYNQQDTVKETLKWSNLWPLLQKFTLNVSYRSHINWIINVGRGELNPVKLPERCRVQSMKKLISGVFGDHLNEETPNRMILTLFNAEVEEMNFDCISQLTRDRFEPLKSYNYFKKIKEGKKSKWYDIDEFMEELPANFPSEVLNLSVKCPIILKRSYEGYPQGTRLVVRKLNHTTITAEVACGTDEGAEVKIHKVVTRMSLKDGNVEFARVQFPVDLCFAMTINKAQGIQFDKAGLYLPRPVFGHGQLYVALSRVEQRDSELKILVDQKLDYQKIVNNVATDVFQR